VGNRIRVAGLGFALILCREHHRIHTQKHKTDLVGGDMVSSNQLSRTLAFGCDVFFLALLANNQNARTAAQMLVVALSPLTPNRYGCPKAAAIFISTGLLV